MYYDPNNIFARILKEEVPVNKVYEDNFSLAFHDIMPKAPVHVLVIPKGEYGTLYDFYATGSDKEILSFHRAIPKIIDLLKIAHHGFRYIVNQGLHGGQEVPHYHVHIVGGAALGPMLVK